MSRGRIRKALSGFYYVDMGDGRLLECRGRGKLRQAGETPLVGDWVEVRETEPGRGMVWEILPRRNAFDRPAAANIDQLVIVASAAVPVTDPYLIDRMTAVAALKDCDVVVCVNKWDLAPDMGLTAIYRARRLSHSGGQRRDRGGHGGAAGAFSWQAICLYRQYRRWQIQSPEPAGPPISSAGGGCE